MPLKPFKPKKLRLSYFDRLRGIVLLRHGKSMREAGGVLANRYPGVPVDVVVRAYFPKKGPFVSARFEGLSRSEVTRLFKEKFQRTAKAQSDHLKALNADPVFAAAHRDRLRALNANPVFAAAHRARARKVMTCLHADPVFAVARDERGRERFRRLNNDPEFRKKKLASLRAYCNSIRLSKTVNLKMQLGKDARAGFEGERLVPTEQ